MKPMSIFDIISWIGMIVRDEHWYEHQSAIENFAKDLCEQFNLNEDYHEVAEHIMNIR